MEIELWVSQKVNCDIFIIDRNGQFSVSLFSLVQRKRLQKKQSLLKTLSIIANVSGMS